MTACAKLRFPGSASSLAVKAGGASPKAGTIAGSGSAGSPPAGCNRGVSFAAWDGTRSTGCEGWGVSVEARSAGSVFAGIARGSVTMELIHDPTHRLRE